MESIYKLMDELLIQLMEEDTALLPVNYRLYLWFFDSILQECRARKGLFFGGSSRRTMPSNKIRIVPNPRVIFSVSCLIIIVKVLANLMVKERLVWPLKELFQRLSLIHI